MINFNEVKRGLNSARMIMIAYLTQAVKMGKIDFNEFSYRLVSHNTDGDISFLKPLGLEWREDEEMCILTVQNGSERTEMASNDLSADDLYTLCEMVEDITGDCYPEDSQVPEETVDLSEDEIEVMAN